MKTNSYLIKMPAFALAAVLAFTGGLQVRASGNNSASTNLPVISVIASDHVALEGTSSGAFTILLYGPTNTAVTVSLGISGTASNGVDYAAISNEVTLPAGSLAVDIPISPLIDTTRRGNKSVLLTVLTNASYQVLYRKKATVEIIDDIYNIPAPTISLTNPVSGATYTNPAVVTLTAVASDPDVAITSVSFYANDDFIGKITNSPYSLTWTNTHAGRYALFARAVDTVDQSTVSAPVNITVTNVPPATTSRGGRH